MITVRWLSVSLAAIVVAFRSDGVGTEWCELEGPVAETAPHAVAAAHRATVATVATVHRMGKRRRKAATGSQGGVDAQLTNNVRLQPTLRQP